MVDTKHRNPWLLLSIATTLCTIALLIRRPSLLPYAICQQTFIWFSIFLFEKISKILQSIRTRPSIFFAVLLLLLAFGLLLLGWVFTIEVRIFVFLSYLWGVSVFIFAGTSSLELSSVIRRFSKTKQAGIFTMIVSLLLMSAATELILRNLLYTTDLCPRMTMAWFGKYWHPVNAEGYRDYEVSPMVHPGVKRIIVVGDSFVAGSGIKRMSDTFPQLLARKFRENYTVNIIAHPGLTTVDEWERLQKYPIVPDILVLSYVYNDADYLFNADTFHPSTGTLKIIRTYFVANLFYHSIRRKAVGITEAYDRELRKTYRNESTWSEHKTNLLRFVQYAREHDCRLIVLAWPILNHMDDWEMQKKVVDFFREQNIEVADINPLLKGIPTNQLIVNFSDVHPSVLAHKIAADLLYGIILHGNGQPHS